MNLRVDEEDMKDYVPNEDLEMIPEAGLNMQLPPIAVRRKGSGLEQKLHDPA